MEPEDPLLCLQNPVTGHYTESDQSSSYPLTQSPYDLFHIILLFVPTPHLFFASDFSTKILHVSRIFLVCSMPHPPHLPLFDHPNTIWWTAQITKLLIMQFSSTSCN
jgi:hypothetical protein